MRLLRDLQLAWCEPTLTQKNHALFAFHEPVLLWARDQRIKSQFSKINLLFSLRSASGPLAEQWLDQADGVYCFTWGVREAELPRLEELGWLRDTFAEAIRAIRIRFAEPGLERLERYVRDELPDAWPLRSTSEKRGLTERRSGRSCRSSRHDRTTLGSACGWATRT